MRRPCLILKNENGEYDSIAIYKNKKDAEPSLVLRPEDNMALIVEEMPFKDTKALCSRNVKLVDMEPDGSHLRLWVGLALDTTNDHMWHPTSLHDEIIENVGPQGMYALYGAFDPRLAKMLMVESWGKYCEWQAKCLNYCATEGGYEVIFSHIHNVDSMGHKFWHHAKPRTTTPEGEARAEAYQDSDSAMHIGQTDKYLGEFLHFLEQKAGLCLIMSDQVTDHGRRTPPLLAMLRLQLMRVN